MDATACENVFFSIKVIKLIFKRIVFKSQGIHLETTHFGPEPAFAAQSLQTGTDLFSSLGRLRARAGANAVLTLPWAK